MRKLDQLHDKSFSIADTRIEVNDQQDRFSETLTHCQCLGKTLGGLSPSIGIDGCNDMTKSERHEGLVGDDENLHCKKALHGGSKG